jgi:hypothetical protein
MPLNSTPISPLLIRNRSYNASRNHLKTKWRNPNLSRVRKLYLQGHRNRPTSDKGVSQYRSGETSYKRTSGEFRLPTSTEWALYVKLSYHRLIPASLQSRHCSSSEQQMSVGLVRGADEPLRHATPNAAFPRKLHVIPLEPPASHSAALSLTSCYSIVSNRSLSLRERIVRSCTAATPLDRT